MPYQHIPGYAVVSRFLRLLRIQRRRYARLLVFILVVSVFLSWLIFDGSSSSRFIPPDFTSLNMTDVDFPKDSNGKYKGSYYPPNAYRLYNDTGGPKMRGIDNRYKYLERLSCFWNKDECVRLYYDNTNEDQVVIKWWKNRNFDANVTHSSTPERVSEFFNNDEETNPKHYPWPSELVSTILLNEGLQYFQKISSQPHQYENLGLKPVPQGRDLLPLRDYFLANPTRNTGVEHPIQDHGMSWHIVTPHMPNATILDYAQNLCRSSMPPRSLADTDVTYRPTIVHLLLTLQESLHRRGLCHDDIKAKNILVQISRPRPGEKISSSIYPAPQTSEAVGLSNCKAGDTLCDGRFESNLAPRDEAKFVLTGFANVRQQDHKFHKTKYWTASQKQWPDCRANDVRRLLKVYLSFLRGATQCDRHKREEPQQSHGDSPTLSKFQLPFSKAFFYATEPWAALYWDYINEVSPHSPHSKFRDVPPGTKQAQEHNFSPTRFVRHDLSGGRHPPEPDLPNGEAKPFLYYSKTQGKGPGQWTLPGLWTGIVARGLERIWPIWGVSSKDGSGKEKVVRSRRIWRDTMFLDWAATEVELQTEERGWFNWWWDWVFWGGWGGEDVRVGGNLRAESEERVLVGSGR